MEYEKENKKEVCIYHSGIIATNENVAKAIVEQSNNTTRLFEKFESLSERFQSKLEIFSIETQKRFEELSNLFQEKLIEYARRPGWIVCIILTIMGSIISIMGTFILYSYLVATK